MEVVRAVYSGVNKLYTTIKDYSKGNEEAQELLISLGMLERLLQDVPTDEPNVRIALEHIGKKLDNYCSIVVERLQDKKSFVKKTKELLFSSSFLTELDEMQSKIKCATERLHLAVGISSNHHIRLLRAHMEERTKEQKEKLSLEEQQRREDLEREEERRRQALEREEKGRKSALKQEEHAKERFAAIDREYEDRRKALEREEKERRDAFEREMRQRREQLEREVEDRLKKVEEQKHKEMNASSHGYRYSEDPGQNKPDAHGVHDPPA